MIPIARASRQQYRTTDLSGLVQLDGLLDAVHGLVAGDVEPAVDGAGEPQVGVLQGRLLGPSVFLGELFPQTADRGTCGERRNPPTRPLEAEQPSGAHDSLRRRS